MTIVCTLRSACINDMEYLSDRIIESLHFFMKIAAFVDIPDNSGGLESQLGRHRNKLPDIKSHFDKNWVINYNVSKSLRLETYYEAYVVPIGSINISFANSFRLKVAI